MHWLALLYIVIFFFCLNDAEEQVEPLTCSAATCEECVASGCGWVGLGTSTCWKSCNYVADISCYSSAYFPNRSQSEICQLVQNEINDVRTCGEPLDCATCVATTRSDGVSKCQWYENTNSCGTGGCFQLGCGSSTCSNENEQPLSCEEAATCDDCLAVDCAWTVDQCLESCNIIADAACYDKNNFPNRTGSDICLIATQDKNDSSICNAQTNCTECVRTITSDRITPCQWFVDADAGSEIGSCCPENSSCGFIGPGLSVCEGENQQCDTFSSCGDCLQSDCAWIADKCIESCSLIADIACYSPETFNNYSKAEICDVAKQDADNTMICNAQSNCSSCIETELSNNTSNCQWFILPDGSDGICCPVGSSCEQFGPGYSNCDDVLPSCKNSETCMDCLRSNCSWAVGNCVKSCSTIADAACYDLNNFPNRSRSEICEISRKDQQDDNVCNSKVNCSDCVETLKSDNNSFCQWYNGNNGYCGTGGCDFNGVCGSSSCDFANSTATTTGLDASGTLRRLDKTWKRLFFAIVALVAI